MIIDSHLHIWDLEQADYPWMDAGMGDLWRTITLAEIEPVLDARGIEGVVLVQASDNADDTRVMLDAARNSSRVVGVVAFSPIDDAVQLAADLWAFALEPIVVGIRNLVHEHPLEWMDRPEVEAGLAVLEESRMPLDLPTNGPAALATVARIAREHPGLPLVIDHLGKPPIGGTAADRDAWRSLIASCASEPSVVAKVSGLYSSTGDMSAWTLEQVQPFFDDALELFGADRLMYGGDWPISVMAGGYERTWDAVTALVAPLAPSERDAILGGTAARVYGTATKGVR